MKRSAKPSAPSRRSAKNKRNHHSVYVVELSRDVWGEPKFRRANAHYDITKPCVYVGMTARLDPIEQLEAGVDFELGLYRVGPPA